MNRHAGIIRWLNDRRRAELRAETSAKGPARKRVHRVLADQITAAVNDLERIGQDIENHREGRTDLASRGGLDARQNTGAEGEEKP